MIVVATCEDDVGFVGEGEDGGYACGVDVAIAPLSRMWRKWRCRETESCVVAAGEDGIAVGSEGQSPGFQVMVMDFRQPAWRIRGVGFDRRRVHGGDGVDAAIGGGEADAVGLRVRMPT